MNELSQTTPSLPTLFGLPLLETEVEQTIDKIVIKLCAGNIHRLKTLSKEKAKLLNSYLEKDTRNLYNVHLIQDLLLALFPSLRQKSIPAELPCLTPEDLHACQRAYAEIIPPHQHFNDYLIEEQLECQLISAPAISWYLTYSEILFEGHPMTWLEEAASVRAEKPNYFRKLIAPILQKHSQERVCTLIGRCLLLDCPNLFSMLALEAPYWKQVNFEQGITYYHLLAFQEKVDFDDFFYAFPPEEGTLSTEKGITPLHMAAITNHTEYFIFLLNKGFSPILQDDLGNTPFHYLAKVATNHTLFGQLLREQQVNYPSLLKIENKQKQGAVDIFLQKN